MDGSSKKERQRMVELFRQRLQRELKGIHWVKKGGQGGLHNNRRPFKWVKYVPK